MPRNQYILKKYLTEHPVCERCNQVKASQVHHILEIVNGGEDNEENLLAVCDDCHKKIHKPNHGELTAKGMQEGCRKNKSRSQYQYKHELLLYISKCIEDRTYGDHLTATDIVDMIYNF